MRREWIKNVNVCNTVSWWMYFFKNSNYFIVDFFVRFFLHWIFYAYFIYLLLHDFTVAVFSLNKFKMFLVEFFSSIFLISSLSFFLFEFYLTLSLGCLKRKKCCYLCCVMTFILHLNGCYFGLIGFCCNCIFHFIFLYDFFLHVNNTKF